MANKENHTNHNQNVEQKMSSEKLRLPLSLTITNESADFKEPKERSPTSVKDMKDILFNSSKNILGKVLSPSKDKQNQVKKVEAKKQPLMTKREWSDPFGSDDEEEEPIVSPFEKLSLKINGVFPDGKNCADNCAKSPELTMPNSVSKFFAYLFAFLFAFFRVG